MIVIDDGCGMTREDAKLSILRHATSKISKDDDLNTISTMGFRGEALPSISAVSKMTIETKRPKELGGYKLVVSGGKVVESGDLGCADGTRIVVEDLFFNTPARKKFLRGDKTEEGHVMDTVGRLALAFPEVRFKVTADGKEKLACLSVNDTRARIPEVFSSNLAATAVPFEEVGSGIKIHGFLGSPDSARGVAQGVYLFVNKRYIRDRTLNHAVVDGYRGLLPSGSYPFAIVMLDIDPSRVDVNVHPTKQEVRFDNVGAIHNFVAAAVRKSIQKSPDHVPEHIQVAGGRLVEKVVASPSSVSRGARQSPEPNYMNEIASSSPLATPRNDIPDVNLQTYALRHLSTLRVIGQLANSYILCESSDGRFVAIDQHAAHERIGFEKLKRQFAERRVEQQQLLLPVQVELQPREAGYITEHLETLNGLGLEIEPFGGKTFMVKAVPSLLSDTDISSLVLTLARELSELYGSAPVEEITEHILKTMACHRQIRANHYLKREEMESLLRQMDEWPNTTHCPHGRPSYKEFTAEDVKKWFNR